MSAKTMFINGKEVEFSNERNLLEVIRKANIEIPTFCYHSELSVYGACRLCLVDVEGRGLLSSCSVTPESGMRVRTHTKEIRDIRKISIELLLANHEQNCQTCSKSSACKLQELANRLGVDNIRFRRAQEQHEIDFSSDALVRDQNKCILCGDCVRACDELQGIGAIDFAHRGKDVAVLPAFDKLLGEVECVDCGQCARVCPTGAITPKSEIEEVWDALDDPDKTVVAQIAPAVRVAIGELFDIDASRRITGRTVAALKMIGFDKVFDTSYAADLTIVEEANEFFTRKEKGEKLPLFTSCCPAWVKFAEEYYPELIDNISTCKSPQQMFGSIAKEVLPKEKDAEGKEIVVVSVMPCTAKKSEANREELNGDVDHVITTQELAAMIKQAGIKFKELTPESLDLPLGFKTGAGVIFGNSGGVTEAVIRYAADKIKGLDDKVDQKLLRSSEGIREIEVDLEDEKLRIAVVHGLKNADNLIKEIKNGKKNFDFVEVMSCPGGCIGGAGQPVSFDEETKTERAKGIYRADKMLQLHKSQENPFIKMLYDDYLDEPNSGKAHELLHTKYVNRKEKLYLNQNID